MAHLISNNTYQLFTLSSVHVHCLSNIPSNGDSKSSIDTGDIQFTVEKTYTDHKCSIIWLYDGDDDDDNNNI